MHWGQVRSGSFTMSASTGHHPKAHVEQRFYEAVVYIQAYMEAGVV
jgi:hypothetical protein